MMRSGELPGAGLSAADDAALFGCLLVDPGLVDEDALFWVDGRVVDGSDPARRTVLGWHRGGGPIVTGVTTGTVGETLFVEALRLAERVAGWSPARWDAVLTAYWGSADPALGTRVRERWGLSGGRPVSAAEWVTRVWGTPIVSGGVRVGVIAGKVPERLRRAITWLADAGTEVAAWEVRRAIGGPAEFRGTPVAGRWSRSKEGTRSAEEDVHRRATYLHRTGGITAELLGRIERRARELDCRIGWSGDEWVRIDGPARSLRVFPGSACVDLQFVGADEGTRTGLAFRYGVPVGVDPPAGAPPGVHLRLAAPEDLSPAVDVLITAWLSGGREGNGGREHRPARSARARPPGREPGRRNRSR